MGDDYDINVLNFNKNIINAILPYNNDNCCPIHDLAPKLNGR